MKAEQIEVFHFLALFSTNPDYVKLPDMTLTFFTVSVFTTYIYGKHLPITDSVFLTLKIVKAQCMKSRPYRNSWVRGNQKHMQHYV